MFSRTNASIAGPTVKEIAPPYGTAVDKYWQEHVVCDTPFQTAQESKEYLEQRFRSYPLFREFSGLYGDHVGEVILDYGCGPGNDLVGFAIYSRAKKIIGIDISRKALCLASHRCSLHDVSPERVELIHSGDALLDIKLPDSSVDFINCQGVLQVTSNPEAILREFYRIMKPESRAVVMVYNYNSIWLHLYTAYQRVILEDAFPGLDAYEAFGKNVDGEHCPIARGYEPEDFLRLCHEAGFLAEYVGGYLTENEMNVLASMGEAALRDERLPKIHRDFLGRLRHDQWGYPTYEGKHAGIGGIYRLYSWNKAEGRQSTEVKHRVARAELADIRFQVNQVEQNNRLLQDRLDELQARYEALQIRFRGLEDWQTMIRSNPIIRAGRWLRRMVLKTFDHLRGSGGEAGGRQP